MKKSALCTLILLLCVNLFSCSRTQTGNTANNAKDYASDSRKNESESTPSVYGKDVLFQIPGKYDVSMGYVIHTGDNRIIVIDGGEANPDHYNDVRDDFIALLRSITGEEKPVIDAWFFSHCHRDHIGVFNELMNGNDPAFDVKNAYYNFPSRDFISRESSDMTIYDNFMSALGNCGNMVVVQTGDIIQVGNASVEVLLTPDETITSNGINESSVVFRATVAQQTVLFLGDLGASGGNRLCRAYGENLRSDVVQMAHHGSNGVANKTYRFIDPEVCLWPDVSFLWDESRNAIGEFSTLETFKYLNNYKKDIKHYLASEEGLLMLEFPIR